MPPPPEPGPPRGSGKRDPESKFVELLWERGINFENEVIANLKIPFADLHALDDEERERLLTG
jgi:hypothetical protein